MKTGINRRNQLSSTSLFPAHNFKLNYVASLFILPTFRRLAVARRRVDTRKEIVIRPNVKSKIGTNLFRQRHGLIGAVQKVRNELNCYMFLVKYKQYVKYDGWLGLTYANRVSLILY